MCLMPYLVIWPSISRLSMASLRQGSLYFLLDKAQNIPLRLVWVITVIFKHSFVLLSFYHFYIYGTYILLVGLTGEILTMFFSSCSFFHLGLDPILLEHLAGCCSFHLLLHDTLINISFCYWMMGPDLSWFRKNNHLEAIERIAKGSFTYLSYVWFPCIFPKCDFLASMEFHIFFSFNTILYFP